MHFHEPNSGLLGQTERSLNWSRINKETLIVTYQAFHDWSVTKFTLNCLDEIDPFIQSCIEMNFANKIEKRFLVDGLVMSLHILTGEIAKIKIALLDQFIPLVQLVQEKCT